MTKLKSPESFPGVQRKHKSMGGCTAVYYCKNKKKIKKNERCKVLNVRCERMLESCRMCTRTPTLLIFCAAVFRSLSTICKFLYFSLSLN